MITSSRLSQNFHVDLKFNHKYAVRYFPRLILLESGRESVCAFFTVRNDGGKFDMENV